ncbi:hypothetical protein GCM10007160_13520 [Litchfieldella qijiaojingensis]|uniref:Uncharacterized protein n=1 Tax=Litchfieldella qijiaojingensis TaxID=980347 RepID=A0ABQ2YNQ2_9GAMM|nr:hypothetical protein [Halomonas qijiaojingensis]GGX87454.1 hypothetical protein GCM10007160_13520 [Halomonas qijiaojingensis]
MKSSIVTGTLLVFSLVLADVSVADSVMEKRFREEGRQLDLTGFLQSENDARSRSFLYGSPHEHDFTVKKAGTYLFKSHVPGGSYNDYRVAAELLDDRGQVLARGEALSQSGGLALRQRLEPGDYVLRVEGQKFGTRARSGNSFYITVSGLDAQGRRLEGSISEGQGLVFTGSGREASRSVFVRNRNSVATIAPPATEAAADVQESTTAEGTAPSSAEPQPPTSEPQAGQATDSDAPRSFERIVTDVKIRARGEVLTFDVVEAGTIAITTATYPTGYEDTYRIALQVLDESGRVVAEGAGKGFDGDVDLRTVLSPGRYRIRVQGQKFGSVMTGVNNYELKVIQLDRQ